MCQRSPLPPSNLWQLFSARLCNSVQGCSYLNRLEQKNSSSASATSIMGCSPPSPRRVTPQIFWVGVYCWDLKSLTLFLTKKSFKMTLCSWLRARKAYPVLDKFCSILLLRICFTHQPLCLRYNIYLSKKCEIISKITFLFWSLALCINL